MSIIAKIALAYFVVVAIGTAFGLYIGSKRQ